MTTDVQLHGLTIAQRLAEEDENAKAMYPLNRKDGPTPYRTNCPLNAIEDVARGLRSEPVILFLSCYKILHIGEQEWVLTDDPELWREAQAYAHGFVDERLLIWQPCQAGCAFGRPESVKPDPELSCKEWQERHNRRCQPPSVCPTCPPPALRKERMK